VYENTAGDLRQRKEAANKPRGIATFRAGGKKSRDTVNRLLNTKKKEGPHLKTRKDAIRLKRPDVKRGELTLKKIISEVV